MDEICGKKIIDYSDHDLDLLGELCDKKQSVIALQYEGLQQDIIRWQEIKVKVIEEKNKRGLLNKK